MSLAGFADISKNCKRMECLKI
ncbi:MAG: hypothetical protein PWP44_1383, partial [Thermacetogenium sp.]|nr:hypothetical protein [Thermacetogenium sp.]